MRINLTGVAVDDQQKALRFYTETLGFRVKHNIPLGECGFRRMPSTHSDSCRPPVPTHVVHSFRRMSSTDSDACRPVIPTHAVHPGVIE